MSFFRLFLPSSFMTMKTMLSPPATLAMLPVIFLARPASSSQFFSSAVKIPPKRSGSMLSLKHFFHVPALNASRYSTTFLPSSTTMRLLTAVSISVVVLGTLKDPTSTLIEELLSFSMVSSTFLSMTPLLGVTLGLATPAPPSLLMCLNFSLLRLSSSFEINLRHSTLSLHFSPPPPPNLTLFSNSSMASFNPSTPAFSPLPTMQHALRKTAFTFSGSILSTSSAAFSPSSKLSILMRAMHLLLMAATLRVHNSIASSYLAIASVFLPTLSRAFPSSLSLLLFSSSSSSSSSLSSLSSSMTIFLVFFAAFGLGWASFASSTSSRLSLVNPIGLLSLLPLLPSPSNWASTLIGVPTSFTSSSCSSFIAVVLSGSSSRTFSKSSLLCKRDSFSPIRTPARPRL
mmetsp:Transcript_19069/g.39714  ORF Transcript_19069/g.39714 Transcript_19069/m.39714 type:complete len:401 (+) Transcript_19069:142-1344(+)